MNNFVLPPQPNLPVLEADLSSRTVLLIGASVGIGYAAAVHFANMAPKRLILTCRDEAKCAETVEAIKKETGFAQVEGWPLELSEFASVKAFGDRFEADGGDLDILVANAAVALGKYILSPDGHETSLQVNHLSGSLLTLLLLPRLYQTAQKNKTVSRVVVMSSDTHEWVDLGKDRISSDVNIIKTLSSQEFSTPPVMKTRYPTTKLLNVLFVRELQAHIPKDAPIVVTGVNPGLCDSKLRRNADAATLAQIEEHLKKGRTSEEGSRQLIRAAVGPDPKNLDTAADLETFKAGYISNNEIFPTSAWSRSEEGAKVQKQVWAETLDLLTEVDPRVAKVFDVFQK